MGIFYKQIGIDCNITLKKSSFWNLLLKIYPGFILRLIFELVNFGPLLSFRLFVVSSTICAKCPSPIFFFTYPRSLIRSNSIILVASKILLLGLFWLPFPLRCSAISSFEMERCQLTFLKNRFSTLSSSDP